MAAPFQVLRDILPPMYCPESRTEYRPSFTRCSDCDVDLAERLPEGESSSDKALTFLWECADQSECVGICRDLKNADIPHKVHQIPYERTAKSEWSGTTAF